MIFSFRNKTPNNIAKTIKVSLNAITTAIGAFENAYIMTKYEADPPIIKDPFAGPINFGNEEGEAINI